MAEIAVGIIGAGGMGTRHAMNILRHVRNARVAAVYDLNTARASEVAGACGSAQAFSDPFELIQDSSVDAVLVASPDPTHADFVRACLEQRKPVLCEKPLATTAADARAIVEAEQKIGRCLVGVGLMRRFDPYHLAVKQAIDSGEIGRALLFKGVHRNATVPDDLPGAIVITNSAIHDLDSARWLLGQEVEKVYVSAVRTRSTSTDETRELVVIQMTHGNGTLSTIEVFVAAENGYEVSAEVVAERGAAITMQPDLAFVRARNARSLYVPSDWLARFQEAYVVELTQWANSLVTGDVFAGANAWDGYMTVLVADACIESLHSGTAVSVATPPRPALYQ